MKRALVTAALMLGAAGAIVGAAAAGARRPLREAGLSVPQVATSSRCDLDLPPEKCDLVASAPSRQIPGPPTPSISLVDARPDAGDSSAVAQLKRDLQAALSLEQHVGALRQGASYDHDAIAAAVRPLSAVYAPDVLDARTTEAIQAIVQTAADPTYHRYDDARWVTERWQGVRLHDRTHATAVLCGHYEYLSGAAWDPEDVVQQQVVLSLGPSGTWLIESLNGISADGRAG